MENPGKHDNNKKKKNGKIMSMAMQIGRSFGMGGGIVLFGGALVVTTIVSTRAIIAFKTRQQHRQSTSKDIHTPNANPDDKELILKSDQDFSNVDRWPLNIHNPSDEVTSYRGMEPKNIQTLTLDEDCNFGSYDDEQMESGDSNEDIMFSIVDEDQENTSIYVDSVFESGQAYEKIALGCEEQVVMTAPTELRCPSSDDEDSCVEILDNGEILINTEKDGQVEAISDEVIQVAGEVEDNNMEYNKATDIITNDDDLLVEDDVAKTTENEESNFINAIIEGPSENEVEVKCNPQVQVLDKEKQIDCDDDDDDDIIPGNCKGDLSNTSCLENPILREGSRQTKCNKKQLLTGGKEEKEEATKADGVDVVNMDEIHANKVGETTPSQLINEEEREEKAEVQERVTTEDDELINKIEIEIPETQDLKETKVDDNETAGREEDTCTPRQLTNKQEKIEEDEIPLVQSIEEEEVSEISLDDELQESLIPEARMSIDDDMVCVF